MARERLLRASFTDFLLGKPATLPDTALWYRSPAVGGWHGTADTAMLLPLPSQRWLWVLQVVLVLPAHLLPCLSACLSICVLCCLFWLQASFTDLLLGQPALLLAALCL